MEQLDGSLALGPDHVGEGERGDHLVVRQQIHGRLTSAAGGRLEGADFGRHLRVDRLEQPRPAHIHGAPIGPGLHAAALQRLETCHPGQRQFLLPGREANAARDGVLGIAFDCSRQSESLFLGPVRDDSHPDDAEPALGQRARLVEDDGVDLARAFQREAVAHQNAILCALGRRNGDDQRDGQPQRVRARDDQDGGDAGNDLDVEADSDRPGDRGEQGHAERDVE